MIRHLVDIVNLSKIKPVKTMVLVNGVDEHGLEAAHLALRQGLIKVVVTGNNPKIVDLCRRININPSDFSIVHTKNDEESALVAVGMVGSGEADFLMKGLIRTDLYMQAILNKEHGILPQNSVLSHVAIIENPEYHKLLFVSDVAVIPYPNVSQKVSMIQYLIQVARALDVENPKIALIAPTEKVIPSIPACFDAAEIMKMVSRNEISGGIIDGPMAFDVAVDKLSALVKGIDSPVAGDADCLLFSNIDAANVFYKVNAKFCHSEQAAVMVGAKNPAVLSSRGDSVQTKLNSIALAVLLCK